MMTELAVWRLNLLRSGYLLLVAGLGATVWVPMLDPAGSWDLPHGIIACMLAALSGLAVLGLRYPLRMLPLLFFEMAWKALWLLRMAWPLWSRHALDAAAAETVFACSIAVVFPFIVPWNHVWETYVLRPGDAWWRKRDVAG